MGNGNPAVKDIAGPGKYAASQGHDEYPAGQADPVTLTGARKGSRECEAEGTAGGSGPSQGRADQVHQLTTELKAGQREVQTLTSQLRKANQKAAELRDRVR